LCAFSTELAGQLGGSPQNELPSVDDLAAELTAQRSELRPDQDKLVIFCEVGEVLDVQRREWQAVGNAAGSDQVSLTGWGRPRWVAAADSSPQTDAIVFPPGITGLSDSHESSIALFRRPQFRSLVHWVSSPTVTNVNSGCAPANRAASSGWSRPLNDREATSVSKTMARDGSSGKVGVAGSGDEGEELVEFLVGLEGVTA